MHEFLLFDCIKVCISEEDWDYLCKNRWFTDAPEVADVRAEFVSGTGITPNKPQLWKNASAYFHDYVLDLQNIADK